MLKNLMALKTGFIIFQIYFSLFISFVPPKTCHLSKQWKLFFNNVFNVMKSDLMSGYLDTRVDTSR